MARLSWLGANYLTIGRRFWQRLLRAEQKTEGGPSTALGSPNTILVFDDDDRLVAGALAQGAEACHYESVAFVVRVGNGDFVSDELPLQYVGFVNTGTVREYAFTLRRPDGAPSEYFVTIANDAFMAHRVRYQDAPEICSLRLHRELSGRTDHPTLSRFAVTDAELAEYKDAHAPKAKPGFPGRRKVQEL